MNFIPFVALDLSDFHHLHVYSMILYSSIQSNPSEIKLREEFSPAGK